MPATADMAATPPMNVRYFYGRISRDEAEQVLVARGCVEGLYLLRESMSNPGNYALSICHQSKVHHYSIERQSDGTVMIQDGRKFKGPVELVQHHEKVLDGFLTKPTKPCDRNEQPPMAWPGVTMLELEQALLDKANNMNLRGSQLENALGPQRSTFIQLVAKELHRDQAWFHDKISRVDADALMNTGGHIDGKFLVRERDDKSYALSLSHKNVTKHYKIDRHREVDKHKATSVEKLAIEDGPRFDNLMDMIGHYHNKTDGLLCKLTTPCMNPNYKKKRLPIIPLEPNRIYGMNAILDSTSSQGDTEDGAQSRAAAASVVKPARSAAPKTTRKPYLPSLQGISLEQKLNDPEVLKKGIISNKHVQNAIWDDPDIPEGKGKNDPPPLVPRRVPPYVDDDPQKIYDSVPRTEDVFNLNKKDIELGEKLGSGNFGSVMRGTYLRTGQLIPVAIKTLKQDDIHNAEQYQDIKSELMKEARVMAELAHRNIVRLIGVCRSETIMLVMELASLGQLSKYLKKHPTLAEKTVLELMFQVAEGMAYLESKNFVHRDLAARNVLLVNEHFAKISDFGMSKALGFGNNYYKAETAGKWPLKWYAPECIYFFKFDSKSDVWSYGVTLWEALSYGAKPYKGLSGQKILEMIENDGRLQRPDRCAPGVYDIMMKCWRYDKDERPTFKEIVEALRKYK